MSGFSATQLENARTIIAVGRHLGASDRDIQIGLMAALQESNLQNVNYGDRDSLGLFQQRSAWAPAADRMDPAKAAAMFFQGGQDGQRGLLDFHNRDRLSLTQAAQATQVSAYPDAYAKWSSAAQELLGSAPSGTSENAVPAASTHTITSANTTSPQAAYTAPTQPGAAVLTAPGAEAVTTAPGAESAVAHLDTPSDSGVLDEESFHAMFPDASATKMFSGAATGAHSNARRGDVVSMAMSYLGVPYMWGGDSSHGLDCSGLVQLTYRSFGVELPRLSADQLRAGRPTAYGSLQPGDLIGWDINSRNNGADHIAVYAGNGRIVEAPRPGLSVRTRALSQHEIDTSQGAHFPQLG